jgi:hypothetical protein
MKFALFTGCLALASVGGIAAAQACDDHDRGYRHHRAHAQDGCCPGYHRHRHRGYAYGPRYDRLAYYDDDYDYGRRYDRVAYYDDRDDLYGTNFYVRDRRFRDRRHHRADRRFRDFDRADRTDRGRRFAERGDGDRERSRDMNRAPRKGGGNRVTGGEPMGPKAPSGMNKGPGNGK